MIIWTPHKAGWRGRAETIVAGRRRVSWFRIGAGPGGGWYASASAADGWTPLHDQCESVAYCKAICDRWHDDRMRAIEERFG